MNEAQVRQLLATLKGDLDKAQNTSQALAFSGGCAALEMVLGEEK